MNTMVVSLDPATHVTGYAIHVMVDKDEKPETGLFALVKYGLIEGKVTKDEKNSKLFDLNMRCLEINSKLRYMIVNIEPSNLVLDFPEYQPRRKSEMPTSRQVEAVRQLAFLCGKIVTGWELYVYTIMNKYKINLPMPAMITPTEWKGQLTKEMTAERCLDQYGVSPSDSKSHNFIDAIMIGDYYIKEVMKHKVRDINDKSKKVVAEREDLV